MKIPNENLKWSYWRNEMKKYSYEGLKSAAASGSRIGMYQGVEVYACSKYKYDSMKNKGNRYYVIYDDNNYMVRNYSIFGTIDSNGGLDVWQNTRRFITPQQVVMESKIEPKVEKKVPATSYSAVVNGGEGAVNTDDFFARLDKEINELLATEFKLEDMPWAN